MNDAKINDVRTSVPTNGGDWVEKFGAVWKEQAEVLRAKFGAEVEEVLLPGDALVDMLTVVVKKSSFIALVEMLKTNSQFDYIFLSDLTATDEGGSPRFRMVYHFYSYSKRNRIRVKVKIDEHETVPTLSGLWKSANWPEREVFDMFGIRFDGHPDLRRILLDERWVGHPLRKDYPLRGYQIFTEPEDPQPYLLKD